MASKVAKAASNLGWQNSVTGDCSGVFAVCFANLNNSLKVHKN
jgi:hypothetical protein